MDNHHYIWICLFRYLLFFVIRYIVQEMLGQGTFGQVAKCWDAETNSYVAVKVIKNQPAFYQQAIMEVSLLSMLNDRFDPDDQHHIVRMLDFFPWKNHLCIAFEMLGHNLYELLKKNSLRGLQLKYVRTFSRQILDALVVMKGAGIIHCDLKPENILITPNVKSAAGVKVIDFGSACMEGKTIYSYIQVLFELTLLCEFHFIKSNVYEFKLVYFPFPEPLLQIT
jgi:dual specificity protein kinase YAK1